METKELKSKYEESRAKALAIYSDHETKAMDADTRKQLDAFLSDAEGYKQQFELKQRDDQLRQWERTPVPGQQPGAAQVLGLYSEPSGYTTVEHKEGSVLVSSEGEGLVPEKALRIISSPEYKAMWKRYLRAPQGISGMDHADRQMLLEVKAAQEGLDPQGGYLVPEDLLNRLVSRTMAPMGLAAKCQHIPTSRDSVIMPKINYLAENDTPANVYDSPVRVSWTGEIPASSTASRTNDLLFGITRIPVWTAMISLLLTMDMLEDAAFPISTYVSDKFGNAVKILYDNMILNGTGVGQPKGILANPGGAVDVEPAVVPTTAASSLTWDGLQNLAYSLPPQYDDGAAMVFNKNSTALAIAKLVDGAGRPFWGMGYQDSGIQDRALSRPLLGYDTILSQLMPNVGTNTFPIILGNFDGYYLVERVGFTVRQLSELYAETNQVVLLGRIRFGGVCVEPWRFKIAKCSVS